MAVVDYMRDEYEALCFQYEFRVASVPVAERTRQPTASGNSLAWVCWHMARNEDVLINSIIQAKSQVFADGWSQRLGWDDVAIGTGYSADDVAAFGKNIDVEVLDAYSRAVAASTRAWLSALRPVELDTVPDVDARLAANPGCLSEAASWVPGVWRGRTSAQIFAYYIIGHGYTHFGEIEDIRCALGLKGL
jgi:hypothetical protein